MEVFKEMEAGVEENGFEELGAVDTATVAESVATPKGNKDELEEQVAKELRTELINNEEFQKTFKSRINDLVVTKTLGFSDEGGQISKGYDDSQLNTKGKAKHLLEVVAEIVGYVVKNQGETPIECASQTWKKDESGKYVAEPSQLVIAPGEEKAITKRDMLLITIQPEFAGEFANGVMVTKLKASEMSKHLNNFDYIANKYYIKFNDKGNGVHDDTVKINISHQEKDGDKTVWVVNDEYKAQFGFLENEPEPKAVKEKKGKKAKTPKTSIKITPRNSKAMFLAKAYESGAVQ